jgi:hypothetical protein
MKFRKDLPDAGSGSKNFLKLKDKESVTGIFRGELYEFFTVWEGGKSRQVPEGTPKAGFRFRINFVLKDGANFVPKIFENGATVYKQLEELHAEYGLDSIVVKLTRNGDGMDTTYSIMPMIKQTITKETAEYLSKLELLPLESKDQNGPATNVSGDEIPF